MKCLVVSVTFRASTAVQRWADALERSWLAFDPDGDHRLRVIAVDNASGDRTVDLLRTRAPFITTLELGSNLGFAAGCNRGLASAEPDELLVVVNPDVSVSEGFFGALAGLDWPHDLAARGPLVIGADGSIEQSARAFPTATTALFGRTSLAARVYPSSRWVRRELRAAPSEGARLVDWISGACMVIPAAQWVAVGPFDESYFMYWEDADWCHRAHRIGLRVQYAPELVVQHHQGSSSAFRPLGSIVAFHRSAWRYQRRQGSGGRAMLAAAAVGLSARAGAKVVDHAARGVPRVVASSVRRRRPRPGPKR